MANVRGAWALTVVAVLSLLATTASAQPEVNADGDTLFVVKADETPTNSEIAVRLAQETPTTDGAMRVVVGRDDDFADALASGLLQSASPLYLVPTDGPLPDGVSAELQRVGAARATILGGTSAVSQTVEADLQQMGLQTDRYEGLSRFETAVEIAEAEGGEYDTVILARAFPAAGSADPTQAYADAIAAGGLSAATGWPILLTQTDVLTGTTRDFLQRNAAQIDTVVALGGTAAISEAAFDDAVAIVGSGERVAGAGRAATAVAVAEKRGAASAADVTRLVLVDGNEVQDFAQTQAGPNAWAAGFAAAGHSAAFDAPILLTAGQTLPPETEAFLSSGIGGDGVVLTCVASTTACEAARAAAGLSDAPPPPPTPQGSATGIFYLGAPVIAGFADASYTQANPDDGLYAFDATTGDVTRLLDSSCQCRFGGDWLPDGQRWAFAGQAAGTSGVHLLDVGSGAIQTLTTEGPAGDGLNGPSPVVAAPDGSSVAFEATEGDQQGIRFVPLDGSQSIFVPVQPTRDQGQQFSNLDYGQLGGQPVVVLTASPPDFSTAEIIRIDPAAGSAEVLLDDAGFGLFSLAPDGQRIALQRETDLQFLDADTQVVATATGVFSNAVAAVTWTPDGSAVVAAVVDDNFDHMTLEVARDATTALALPFPQDRSSSGVDVTPDSTLVVRPANDPQSVQGPDPLPAAVHVVDRRDNSEQLIVMPTQSATNQLAGIPRFPG